MGTKTNFWKLNNTLRRREEVDYNASNIKMLTTLKVDIFFSCTWVTRKEKLQSPLCVKSTPLKSESVNVHFALHDTWSTSCARTLAWKFSIWWQRFNYLPKNNYFCSSLNINPPTTTFKSNSWVHIKDIAKSKKLEEGKSQQVRWTFPQGNGWRLLILWEPLLSAT